MATHGFKEHELAVLQSWRLEICRQPHQTQLKILSCLFPPRVMCPCLFQPWAASPESDSLSLRSLSYHILSVTPLTACDMDLRDHTAHQQSRKFSLCQFLTWSHLITPSKTLLPKTRGHGCLRRHYSPRALQKKILKSNSISNLNRKIASKSPCFDVIIV